jgi:hypothetical protein
MDFLPRTHGESAGVPRFFQRTVGVIICFLAAPVIRPAVNASRHQRAA